MNKIYSKLWIGAAILIQVIIISAAANIPIADPNNPRSVLFIAFEMLALMLTGASYGFNEWFMHTYNPEWRQYLKSHLDPTAKLTRIYDYDWKSMYEVKFLTTIYQSGVIEKYDDKINNITDKDRIIVHGKVKDPYIGTYTIRGVPLYTNGKALCMGIELNKEDFGNMAYPTKENIRRLIRLISHEFSEHKNKKSLNEMEDSVAYIVSDVSVIPIIPTEVEVWARFFIPEDCIVGYSKEDYDDQITPMFTVEGLED